MIPTFGMVILPQNLSTGNAKIPGCSCILSVVARRRVDSRRAHVLEERWRGVREVL